MRPCPHCRTGMQMQILSGVEIDICPACHGVFLDAAESDATGIETSELFGRAARPAGPSSRMCPGGKAMTRFMVDLGDGTSVEIDRSSCCGGVFLDAGEHQLLQAASQRFRAASTGGVPAPAAVPRPSSSGPPACPRCNHQMSVDRAGGVAIDICEGCGGTWMEAQDAEAKRMDISAVFGCGPEAATEAGPSDLTCPACSTLMVVYHVKTLAGVLEVDRAPCCGGLFLDGGENDAFDRASRIAEQDRADRQFAKGEEVSKLPPRPFDQKEYMKLRAQMDSATAAVIRGCADRAVARLEEERRRRDDWGDDDWDDDW